MFNEKFENCKWQKLIAAWKLHYAVSKICVFKDADY